MHYWQTDTDKQCYSSITEIRFEQYFKQLNIFIFLVSILNISFSNFVVCFVYFFVYTIILFQ